MWGWEWWLQALLRGKYKNLPKQVSVCKLLTKGFLADNRARVGTGSNTTNQPVTCPFNKHTTTGVCSARPNILQRNIEAQLFTKPKSFMQDSYPFIVKSHGLINQGPLIIQNWCCSIAAGLAQVIILQKGYVCQVM